MIKNDTYQFWMGRWPSFSGWGDGLPFSNELQFTGLVVSDDMTMGAVEKIRKTADELARSEKGKDRGREPGR